MIDTESRSGRASAGSWPSLAFATGVEVVVLAYENVLVAIGDR